MSADALLARLDRVKRTGDGRWLARCPAHEDRSPSLSIRDTDDGRTLLHCFAGCSVEQVVAALGLKLEDLFPPRPPRQDHIKGERRPFLPQDLFDIVRAEVGVVAVIAMDMNKNRSIDGPAYERLLKAATRLDDIARAAYGR